MSHGRRAWVISVLLVGLWLALYYQYAFHTRDELIASCQRVNQTRNEINDRTPKFNAMFRIERDEFQAHPQAAKLLTPVHNVKTVDCDANFDKPWPF